MTERTPLLLNNGLFSSSGDNIHNIPTTKDVYDRFTPFQQWYITLIVSVAGLLGLLASGCFIPTILEIAKDLNTSGTIVNYTVGAYILVIAVGSLIWAPYASYYGRRPVYLCSLPLVTLGSAIAASAGNVSMLVIGRSIQAFGTSCSHSVGAVTISDIYRLEERGTGMGIFFGIMLLGPPVAPLTGGLLATYASWRITQHLLGFLGLSCFLSVYLFLPETAHPGTRGVDLDSFGSGVGPSSSTSWLSTGRTMSLTWVDHRWKWVWLNPFGPFLLMRGRVIFMVVISSSLILACYFVLLIPVAYTLAPAYGLTTPAEIGACFLANGLGSATGAAAAGRLADQCVIRGKSRRQGKWYPEDRLLATIPGGLILLPFALLGSGLTISYVPGKVGLVLNLVFFFMAGFGLDALLAPAFTYLVDVLRSKGGEVMALSSAVRYTFCAVTSATALPLIDSIGLVYTNSIAAILAWFAFILLCITMKYGNELRAAVDVGYTIAGGSDSI